MVERGRVDYLTHGHTPTKSKMHAHAYTRAAEFRGALWQPIYPPYATPIIDCPDLGFRCVFMWIFPV